MIDKKASGKSRISGARAHRLLRQWVATLNDIYGSAPHWMPRADELTEMVRTRIFLTPEWSRVPFYSRYFLDGMWEARRNELYRHHLVWVLSLDGALLTRSQVDALADREDAGLVSHPVWRAWSRINNERSRYVWKNLDGTPRLDKPY